MNTDLQHAFWPAFRRAAIGASATGVAIGSATGLVEVTTYFTASPIAMGVALMACGALGISEDFRSPLRGFWRYGLRAFAVWLGYAATWALAAASAGGAGPVSTIVMFRTTAMGVAISAVFGVAMAAFHALRKQPADEGEFELRLPLKRRIAEKLTRWIDGWANRIDVGAAADKPNAIQV